MNYKLDLYQSTVDSIHGYLAGGAIGDSFGFPYEGLTKKRAVKLLGYPFPNKLLFGYGMLSDDTEHACMTAISLIQSSGQSRLFEKALINQLRSWFLCLPPAAIESHFPQQASQYPENQAVSQEPTRHPRLNNHRDQHCGDDLPGLGHAPRVADALEASDIRKNKFICTANSRSRPGCL